MNILHTRDNKKCIYIYNYIYILETQPSQTMQNVDMKQNMSSIQRMASLQKKNPWPRLSDLNKPNPTSPTSEPPVPRVYLIYIYRSIHICIYIYTRVRWLFIYLYTIWLFNIAMESHHFGTVNHHINHL
jgi:hypothetical protein